MSKSKDALGKALEKELGIKKREEFDGLEDLTDKVIKENDEQDLNIRPWLRDDNPEREFAKARFDSLSTKLREHISRFNLDYSVEEVLKEIPVYHYDLIPNTKSAIRTNVDKLYTRLTVSQIVNIVSETGSFSEIWDTYKIIGKDNFFKWMHRYPEFLYLMLVAKENFRIYAWKLNPDIKRNAIKAIADAISGNRKEIYKIVTEDEDGNKTKQISERTMAPPKWVIEKALGLDIEASEEKRGPQVTELTLEE